MIKVSETDSWGQTLLGRPETGLNKRSLAPSVDNNVNHSGLPYASACRPVLPMRDSGV